jgi:RNA polymerase sigma factor (sigma-70 family)
MATGRMSEVIQHLRRSVLLRDGAGLTDGQLLSDYLGRRDEAALASLVCRHGPMVWGVCRRVLRNYHDAEDAFQATFLVFVRKAASIASRELLAGWLYGVAHQTALKTRATAARRKGRERHVTEMPEPAVTGQDHWSDLQPLLDEELSRLPDRYRVLIVLCDLEGKTRKEVARQLGCPEGTVAGRLARARTMLARRLTQRGVVLSGGALAAVLSQQAASAGVPTSVASSTIKTASLLAAGRAAATGAISVKVAGLAEGVLKSMLLTKVKGMIAVLLVLGIVTLGTGTLLSRGQAVEPPAGGRDREPANRDDLHDRVTELKQQLRRMQTEVARLEQETSPRREESNPSGALLADRLKHKVPFEIGYTETSEGGRIEIQEVWGTRPRIEEGGQYLVRGKYVLPPGERGKLYFYETAEGAGGVGPTLDLQYTALDKEKGEFALLHGMTVPGYFHLYLASPDRYSRYFANVYFGTGDNVLRKKP